jgi:molybdopterin-guanine dinucleotide biosynthesis protein B
MTFTRAVAVVGFKKSGKTQVVEALVEELTSRGYKVGTLKHTAEDVPLDTPGKDTWRHREAGSKATGIMHERGAAFFIDRYLTVNEAIDKLGSLDFVIIEGFKSLNTLAKIIVPREAEEIETLSNGLEIAILKPLGGELSLQSGVPVIPIGRAGELADLVERRAFPLLPGLNCGGCGYDDCKSLAVAILAGVADVGSCVGYSSGDFSLRVNDEAIPLGPFVQSAMRNVVLGFVKSLKGVEDPFKVELMFDLGG